MNNNWTREQADEMMKNKLFEEGKKRIDENDLSFASWFELLSNYLERFIVTFRNHPSLTHWGNEKNPLDHLGLWRLGKKKNQWIFNGLSKEGKFLLNKIIPRLIKYAKLHIPKFGENLSKKKKEEVRAAAENRERLANLWKERKKRADEDLAKWKEQQHALDPFFALAPLTALPLQPKKLKIEGGKKRRRKKLKTRRKKRKRRRGRKTKRRGRKTRRRLS